MQSAVEPFGPPEPDDDAQRATEHRVEHQKLSGSSKNWVAQMRATPTSAPAATTTAAHRAKRMARSADPGNDDAAGSAVGSCAARTAGRPPTTAVTALAGVGGRVSAVTACRGAGLGCDERSGARVPAVGGVGRSATSDRKSTRLNSSH